MFGGWTGYLNTMPPRVLDSAETHSAETHGRPNSKQPGRRTFLGGAVFCEQRLLLRRWAGSLVSGADTSAIDTGYRYAVLRLLTIPTAEITQITQKNTCK